MGWIGEAREFKAWGYTASHAQLLLRSVSEQRSPGRVDVLFKDVGFVLLDTTMTVDRIVEAEEADVVRVGGQKAMVASSEMGRRAFLIAGPLVEGLVMAGAVHVSADELSWFEASTFRIPLMGSSAQGVL
jgi:hypothetical protein